jgi:hypothetical protein
MSTTSWRVWVGSSRLGRCPACRVKVRWAITDRGANVPIDVDEVPLRLERDDRGRQFQVYAPAALHWVSCASRNKTPARVRS